MTTTFMRKTALLPKINIRETQKPLWQEHGRGDVDRSFARFIADWCAKLVSRLKRQLKSPALPVVATGGYARLMARGTT